MYRDRWRPPALGQLLWTVTATLVVSLQGPAGMEGPLSHGGTRTGPRDYCAWTKFETNCKEDEIILMKSARYGRMEMRENGCLTEDHGYTGCSADVLPQLDRICSGLRSCELDIPNQMLQKVMTCPKEIVSYLQADYECVKVASATSQVCQSEPLLLSPPSGFISSAVTEDTGFGLTGCPWILHLKPGRRVNFTLLNFAYSAAESSVGGGIGVMGGNSRTRCQHYVRISEGNKVKNITGCLGEPREQKVYTSETNVVRVEVVPARGPADARRFLLKYEAFGCPNLRISEGMSMRRSGNNVEVKCNHTGERFFLTCEGTEWIGQLGNCSKAPRSSGIVRGFARFPYGLLVVIGIGVALGVAVGIVMLMSILICLKRRKEKQLRSLTTDPLLEETPHENEDNHANCNCEAAKIYLSTLEARSRATLVSRDLGSISSTGSSREQLGSGPLPMPDMCLLERPAAPDMVPDGGGGGGGGGGGRPGGGEGEDHVEVVAGPRREMQTSFITFKPTPPRPCQNCGSPVHQVRTPPSRPGSVVGSPQALVHIPGTLRHKQPDSRSEIYSRLPRDSAVFDKRLALSACSECAKENTLRRGATQQDSPQMQGNKSV